MKEESRCITSCAKGATLPFLLYGLRMRLSEELSMNRLVLFFCLALFAAVIAGPPAQAFTEEPLAAGGKSGGQGLADPSDQYRNLGEPAPARGQGEKPGESSPFSFGVTGPGSQYAPSVNRPGIDNDHLYWNNSSRYQR